MIEEIFACLPKSFSAEEVTEPVSYYFSLGAIKRTVRLSPQGCIVEEGRTVDNGDCVCKTSPEFFLKIWQDGYRPGVQDFLSGTIKSNNPNALQLFLRSFGKLV